MLASDSHHAFPAPRQSDLPIDSWVLTLNSRPALLITIDTEGDNLWARPREITTRNAASLPRFQELCERYNLKPTWLTTYEMACCAMFREFARDVIRRGRAEIGMHLHAWNSPPIEPLTPDDYRCQPYLIEYPESILREKVHFLTDLLREAFGCQIVSHRAGRWAFDERYARVLRNEGYRVDCSVTPRLSWSHVKGAANGRGGSDYRRAPDTPYFLSPDNVASEGDSSLLEVPMTTRPARRMAWSQGLVRLVDRFPSAMLQRLRRRFLPDVRWLRPNGRNRKEMVGLLRETIEAGHSHAEFMLHSSELMPGGSPRFRNDAAVEELYDDMEALFDRAKDSFLGTTLQEFCKSWTDRELPKIAEVGCAGSD